MSLQAPSAVVMIRPHRFRSNPETRDDNSYQTASNGHGGEIAEAARREFDGVVATLRSEGITVHDFDDTGTDTPDSVFPNNWFSTHAGGHVAVYPMHSANRRRERRWDIIEMLKRDYRVQDVIDYSGLEADQLALEGTGAMVLDHVGRVAYVVRSNRADPVLLERFCTHFNFEPMVFDAADAQGRAVYHTNVLMGIGTNYALIGLSMISDRARRATVAARLEESGHEVIALSEDQINHFAGNVFEMTGRQGRVLALSQTAFDALAPAQIALIERSARLLPVAIPTLETAGGSVRCMIAGIHLSRRSKEG
jgi:hypothetical protein